MIINIINDLLAIKMLVHTYNTQIDYNKIIIAIKKTKSKITKIMII